MEELGPLSLMYSWQALLCATAAFSVTRLVKAVMDVTIGREKRKTSPWISQVALPLVPVLIGALYAVVVPLRPQVLIDYSSANLSGFWSYVGYAGWGAACGQFSTMLHQKLKDFLQSKRVDETS